MTENGKRKTILGLTLGALAILAAVLVIGLVRGGEWGERAVFVVDFEAAKHIPPEKIGYEQTDTIPCPLETARGIAVAPDGRVFLAGDRNLLVLKDKQVVHDIPLDFGPACVAVDADGIAFVGGEARIIRVDAKGDVAPFATLDPRALIYSLAATDESVFVGDPALRYVWRFDRSGNLLARMGREDPAKGLPKLVIPSANLDVAVSPAGEVWMVNPGMLQLQALREDGSLASRWGETGSHLEGFSGCCNPAHIALLPDGSFVTAEKGLDRVKVYNVRGDFATAVAGADRFDSDGAALDLACDGAGRIYVLDPAARLIRVFTRMDGA